MDNYDFDNTAKIDKWLLRGVAGIIALMVGGCVVKDALAHEATTVNGYPLGWEYPTSCCNSAAASPNGDCAPIRAEYVKEGPNGYEVNIPVGGHPKLTDRGYSAVIPYGQEKVSPEGNYHICLAVNGIYRYCFFAGAKGL